MFAFKIFLIIILKMAAIVSPTPPLITLCNENRGGTCKPISECEDIFQNYHMIYNTIKFCNISEGIVCCPNPIQIGTIPVLDTKHRKFERKCQEYNALIRNRQCLRTPFIVNGLKAEPREFPFMALVGLGKCGNDSGDDSSNKINWKFGGTLISPKFVLTAAHCMETNCINQKFYVRLGELDYNITTDDALPQNFDVINHHSHPDYIDENLFNDIALMELDRNAILNEYVMPACLPSNSDDFSLYTATGWGMIGHAASLSTHLRKVTLNRFDNDKCINTLMDHQINIRTQICVGSVNDTGDTCFGDSGGPIFVTHPNIQCMKQIIGVTSYGPLICGLPNRPNVYTRVNFFTEWIEKIVWP